MEKIISMKFAVVIFLVVTSVMSIEATRLLPEETLETMLQSESLPHGEEKIHCQKGCHVECFPDPFIARCSCVCKH
ncbi:unnamed protein product [Brassica oleracea var. botrytis]|uniref:BnaC05g47960D protein n=5 Tax=Brassica TaxID=3705 RepID=A0A078II35_BRANA|nr:hypothetical protein HID58_069011 [Brassica napus]CAG7878457.1 unnamed protein product [Brassica rapa]VDD47429.1 unnamed protein product [Brassica oleracea]CAF1940382.1 unnamed protein product [Brassica napus]CAF2103398.1 unnamed protein product [Brassica napus]